MNIANSAVRAIIRVKKTLIRAIMDIRANIFIIILPIVKKLKMTMGLPNRSKIIVIDQTKKNIIKIVKNAFLSI